MNSSYQTIVPSALADRLIAIRDSSTFNSWETGDITEQVIQFCAANYPGIELNFIYSAVGSFVGKASRTVREKHYISKFYPLEIRESYNILSYDHFRVAVRLGPSMAMGALAWAVAQGDILNRPCSVDALMARFATPMPGEPETPNFADTSPFDMIYGTVSRQVDLMDSWIGYDLPSSVLCRLKDYYQAGKKLQAAIEAERVEA